MFRFYLKGFGALFVTVGLLTIVAPTGGVLVILGVAMFVLSGVISLTLFAYRKAADATRHLVAAWRTEVAIETSANSEWLPAPSPNPIRPLHA